VVRGPPGSGRGLLRAAHQPEARSSPSRAISGSRPGTWASATGVHTASDWKQASSSTRPARLRSPTWSAGRKPMGLPALQPAPNHSIALFGAGARTSGSTTSCWSATRLDDVASARDIARRQGTPIVIDLGTAHERSHGVVLRGNRRSSRSSTAGRGARSTSRAGRSGATTPSSRSGPPGADRACGPDGTHDRGRRQLTARSVADPAAARGRRMERGRGRRGTSVGRRHRAVRARRFDRRACPAPNPRGEQVLAASALALRHARTMQWCVPFPSFSSVLLVQAISA